MQEEKKQLTVKALQELNRSYQLTIQKQLNRITELEARLNIRKPIKILNRGDKKCG